MQNARKLNLIIKCLKFLQIVNCTSFKKYLISILHSYESEIVSPDQLEQHPIRGVVGGSLILVSLHLPENVTWREGAKSQPVNTVDTVNSVDTVNTDIVL